MSAETENEPMTKREQIAAMMMQAQVHAKEGWYAEDAAVKAVSFADALLAELKRRKESEQ